MYITAVVANGYDGSSDAFFGGALGLADGAYSESIGTPVHAAISTKRTFEVRPIMLESQPAIPSVVDIKPSEQPVQVRTTL